MKRPEGQTATLSKSFKDGAIKIFVRPDYKQPTWMCRLKVPGIKGFLYRSCRTTDEHAAYKFADDEYNRLYIKVLKGEDPLAKPIAKALDDYAKTLEPDRHRQSVHYKILLTERIKPHLTEVTFDDLDTALIAKLIANLAAGSRLGKISPNTVKRMHSDLKHFFNWSEEQGLLKRQPKFPKVYGIASRRPHFDAADWRKIYSQFRSMLKCKNRAVIRDRQMMINYVLILANTGIRVGEARTLKWRDVTTVKGDVVLTVRGKTGMRDVVARTREVRKYFDRLERLRISELSVNNAPLPTVDPDSLVFCHPDGRKIGSFKKSFQTLLKRAGVETDSFGSKRSIYSLRHTYATFRLQEGVNHYALAKNMGTSVAMLEKHYGHTTNIAAADELTKGRSR